MPGPNVDNVPTFAKGELLTAAKLNAFGDTMRRQAAAPGTFQTGGFTVQRPLNGSGDDAALPSLNLGLVVETAIKNFGTPGKYVPIDDSGNPTVIIDDSDPGWDEDAYNAAVKEFQSAHVHADCLEGCRVQVFSFTFPSFGSTATITVGLLTDCLDELKQRPGFGADKVLYSDGADADNIKFDNIECDDE